MTARRGRLEKRLGVITPAANHGNPFMASIDASLRPALSMTTHLGPEGKTKNMTFPVDREVKTEIPAQEG
jgi:hypothetical protein